MLITGRQLWFALAANYRLVQGENNVRREKMPRKKKRKKTEKKEINRIGVFSFLKISEIENQSSKACLNFDPSLTRKKVC